MRTYCEECETWWEGPRFGNWLLGAGTECPVCGGLMEPDDDANEDFDGGDDDGELD